MLLIILASNVVPIEKHPKVQIQMALVKSIIKQNGFNLNGNQFPIRML